MRYLLRAGGSTACVSAANDADAGCAIDIIVRAATIDAARLLVSEILMMGEEALDLRSGYTLFGDSVPAERSDPSLPAADD